MERSRVRSEQAPDPDPEFDLRPRFLAPTVIGCVGVAGSLVLAGSLWFAERSAVRNDFALDSRKLVDAARRELQLHFEQLHALSSLYRGSQLVEPSEFRAFTEPSFARHPALRAMFWIEDTAREVGMSAGPEADDYAPGAALAEHAELAALVAHSRSRSELTLSVPLARAQETRVLALTPVESGTGAHGFVGGVYDVQQLLARAASTPGMEHVLLSAQDGEFPDLPLVRSSPTADPDERRTEELELGGRKWRLTSAPPAGFLARQRTWRPWLGLSFGLLATGLLIATFVMASGRGRILRLVEGRTREVKQAYATLSHEAKERMWALGERRLLEQQLRAVIDLVPDRIFVRDVLGRYLLANQATAEAYGTTVEELTAARNVDRNSPPLHLDRPLSEEQQAMLQRRDVILPALPFVDRKGRRRILRQVMIPCDVFGAQLGAMLCVATDITEQKQAEDVLRAQNRLLSELARGEDPELVLAHIVRAAEELVLGMRCSVLLMASDGCHLRRGFAPSLPEEYNAAIDGLEIGPRVGSCGAAAALGERVVVGDVLTHPNWAPYRDLARRADIRACWSQPIHASDRTILGTFALYYTEPRLPEPFEERFIEAMAHMAGMAIERARSATLP